MDIMLIILLFFFFFGGISTAPVWGYSHDYGYGPSGFMLILFIVLLVYLIRGRNTPI